MTGFTWAEQKPITWLVYNHSNISQLGIDIIQENISDRTHIKMDVSIARMNIFLAEKEDIYCTIRSNINQERFRHLTHSKVTMVEPPAGLIVRSQDSLMFGLRKIPDISLTKLLLQPNLLGAHAFKGFYGNNISQLINKYDNLNRATTESLMPSLKMLMHQRVDYILSYPLSFWETARQLPPEFNNKATFIPLNEDKTHQKRYAVCNNSNASKQVIDKINNVLATSKYRNTMTDTIESFLPSALKKQYRPFNLSMIGR